MREERNTNNDLISREALINVILNDRKLDGANANWEVNRILVHIEKAPSINPCDNCDLYFKATTKEIDRWYKKEEQKGGAE